MEATSRTRPVLGIDVGKRSHWACLVTAEGEIALNAPVANRERDLDELFSGVPGDALVVVDQVRNIGSLALKRAAVAGLESAYLPGTAMHGASRLFAGDAKTDERDALVIAKTAIGIPDSLLPVPRPDAVLDAARAMASQRDYLVAGATRDKNRLRSILLESCPAFESLVDLSDPHCLRMLSEIGGPWQVLDAGKSSVGAVTRGANRARIDALWESISTSTRPDGLRAAAEGASVRLLAKRVSDRLRAGHRHRHRRVRQPRQARLLLRAGAPQQAVGDLRIVGHGIPPGEQEAEEPARVLVQLTDQERQPVRRLLPEVQGPGHAPRQGAQGRRQEEAEGDLRDHEGQGALRGLASRREKPDSEAPRRGGLGGAFPPSD